MTEQQPFREWVVLELLGHRRLGGLLSEQEIAGHGFLRLDVPETERGPASTHYYSPTSVYAINPVTEEIARAVALSSRPAPVQRWELPAPQAAPIRRGSFDDPDDDGGDDGYDDDAGIVDPEELPFD